jgi:hypothetical protein
LQSSCDIRECQGIQARLEYARLEPPAYGSTTSMLHAWERFVLAFQCHPEVRHEGIESWLVGHACEIAATSDVSVERLRNDTQRLGPTLAGYANRAFTDWLASVGL